MNTIQKTDNGGVGSRRGLGLIAAAAVVGAIGIAIGADFGGERGTSPLGIDASVRDVGRAAPAVAPPGGISDPLDPELLRLDRANDHHG